MVQPLDLIGRSQTAPNTELRNLASGLTQILEQNRGRQSVADTQAAASKNVAALGQGFPNYASIVPSEMGARRAANLNLTRAQVLPHMAKTGLYPVPQPGADVTGSLDPRNKVKEALPSGALAQMLSGLAATRETKKTGKKVSRREILLPDKTSPTGQRPYNPIIDVRDIEETEGQTETTKGREGGQLDRFGQPITAPTPSAAATEPTATEPGGAAFDAFSTEPGWEGVLAAQGLKRGYINKGPNAGDWVVYRQVGNSTQEVARKKKGTF